MHVQKSREVDKPRLSHSRRVRRSANPLLRIRAIQHAVRALTSAHLFHGRKNGLAEWSSTSAIRGIQVMPLALALPKYKGHVPAVSVDVEEVFFDRSEVADSDLPVPVSFKVRVFLVEKASSQTRLPGTERPGRCLRAVRHPRWRRALGRCRCGVQNQRGEQERGGEGCQKSESLHGIISSDIVKAPRLHFTKKTIPPAYEKSKKKTQHAVFLELKEKIGA